jgi:hypothetical protein
MSTSYELIYVRFRKTITDFDLADLSPSGKATVELELLQNAITKYIGCGVVLSDRNDGALIFNNDLSENNQQVLAYYMAQSWAEPYMNNQDLFELNFATLEYNAFSSANKMKAIKDVAEYSEKQAGLIAAKDSVLNIIGGLG